MNRDLHNLVEPDFIRFTPAYLRRLIVEAPYIYERLYNPSGSIILQQHAATPEYTNRYSTSIGHTFHCDLMDAAIILRDDFTKEERRLLYDWALGMNAYQAADYYGVTGDVVRKRRSRAVAKLRRILEHEQSEDTGRAGDSAAGSGRQVARDNAVPGGDTRRTPSVPHSEEGDTHEPIE